jgi:hypothetical protein
VNPIYENIFTRWYQIFRSFDVLFRKMDISVSFLVSLVCFLDLKIVSVKKEVKCHPHPQDKTRTNTYWITQHPETKTTNQCFRSLQSKIRPFIITRSLFLAFDFYLVFVKILVTNGYNITK